MRTIKFVFSIFIFVLFSYCTSSTKQETAEEPTETETPASTEAAIPTPEPEKTESHEAPVVLGRWERMDGDETFEFYDDGKVCFGMKNTEKGKGSLTTSPINGQYTVTNNIVIFSITSPGETTAIEYEGEFSSKEMFMTCKKDEESFKMSRIN